MIMKLIEWCCPYFIFMENIHMNHENEIYDEETNKFVTQFNDDAINIPANEEYMDEFEEIEELEQESMNDWGFWFKL